jgi:DNA-binding MarR family transcriptional regulator
VTSSTDLVAQQLWDFVYAYDAAYDEAAQSVGLSSAQACLLKAVAEGPRTMGDLATTLLCDASNVTQLVTRMESKGLVRRQPGAVDRRSREVVITPAGTELDAAARVAFDFPAERINRLPASARDTLSELLAALSTDTQGRTPRPPAPGADGSNGNSP